LKSDFVQSFSDWCNEMEEKIARGEVKLPPMEIKEESQPAQA